MSDEQRLAAILARLADVSDTRYSMYDFGPMGCTVGDAYFFGDAREDVAHLLTLVKTPAAVARLEAALIEERAMTRYSCEPGNLDWHEEVERVHVFYREKARAELVADGLLYDAEKGATDDDNG